MKMYAFLSLEQAKTSIVFASNYLAAKEIFILHSLVFKIKPSALNLVEERSVSMDLFDIVDN